MCKYFETNIIVLLYFTSYNLFIINLNYIYNYKIPNSELFFRVHLNNITNFLINNHKNVFFFLNYYKRKVLIIIELENMLLADNFKIIFFTFITVFFLKKQRISY